MAEGISSIPSFLLGNIKQAPVLKIQPGQILTGTTLEVNAGQAVLLLQGINVVAELETALTPGERVALQVEALTSEGKILLKKLDWGENKSGQEMSEQELKTVLQHFGLPEGKFNQSLVAEMLRSRLPISGPHLQQLAAFAAANDLSPAEVPALIWLWSQKLPLTPEAVAASHNLMESGPDSSYLQDLFAAFAALPSGETEKTSLRHLLADWGNLPVSSSDTPATAAVKIETLIERLGLNFERALLQLTETGEGHNLKGASRHPSKNTVENILEDRLLNNTPDDAPKFTGEGDAKKATQYPTRETAKDISSPARESIPKEALQPTVEDSPKDATLEMMGDATKKVLKDVFKNSGNIATDTAKVENLETSLKYTLLKLLQSPEIQSTPDQILAPAQKSAHPLEVAAQKMLEEITGLQLLNVSGQQKAAESSSTFLAAWASFPEDKLLPLFLKIKRYKQQREEAENPLYQIFFLLNTRHLGQVVCRLSLAREHLSCGFTVRGKAEKKLMDNYLGFLRQRLEGLPWQIIMHPTKISSSEEIKRSWREEFFASGPGRPKVLDTRV